MNLHPFTRPLSLLAWALLTTGAALSQRSAGSPPIEKILEAIGAQPGSTVCEIGAGDGTMSIAAAKIVGPEGRIYSSELGEGRVRKLQEKVAASGLDRITVVAGTATRTNLPDAACDGVFMRDVYHHITEPAALSRSILDALKPGGRLAVIDFRPSGEEAEVAAGRSKDGKHGVKAETVSSELEQAGFRPVTSEVPTQRWFMVVVSKPQR